MRKLAIAVTMMVGFACNATMAAADVTGDFKLVSATYLNSGDKYGGDVTVSGTVNHGAIQSGKTVQVDVSYDYSFAYQMTSTTTQTVPPRCPNPDDNACRSNNNSANWRPSTITVTQVITATSSGMKAITEPTITASGRLNPKGKITGYNWTSNASIVPTDDIVDPNLIPMGATLVSGSVEITNVSYTAFLKDSFGYQIPDTVISGVLFPVQ